MNTRIKTVLENKEAQAMEFDIIDGEKGKQAVNVTEVE